MEQYIHCTKENAVAIVTINRPKALNALNPDVLRELHDTMELLDGDSSVKAVIVTGAGEKAFVAGADIASMSTMTPEQALDFAKAGHRTMNRVAAMKKVTIAAINGFALGGGCELAMACDIRIASSKARMGIPEVTLGVIPGFGGTQRLSRLVGLGMAMELLATGRQVDAGEAIGIGLVNRFDDPVDQA
ncbi:MAG: enoyl-CoA hydratase/isomerase family protein, partial [Oscillospiraceae bacterium]|nr:enoyl-CoA hydratase/isomerase family protein [Oscillospiraceae bacterium]